MSIAQEITIKTSDKVIFVLELSLCRQCTLFERLLACGSVPEVVPLVIHSSIMAKIIDFLNHYIEETDGDVQHYVDGAAPDWCTQFLEANYTILHKIYEAANYLGAHRLSTNCRTKIEEIMEPTPSSSRNADTINLFGGRNTSEMDHFRRYRSAIQLESPRTTIRNMHDKRKRKFFAEPLGQVRTKSNDSTATNSLNFIQPTCAEDAYTLALIESMMARPAEVPPVNASRYVITTNPVPTMVEDFDAPSTSHGARQMPNDLSGGGLFDKLRSQAGYAAQWKEPDFRFQTESVPSHEQQVIQMEAVMNRARRHLRIEDYVDFEEQNAVCLSRLNPFVRNKNDKNRGHNITAFRKMAQKPLNVEKAEEKRTKEEESKIRVPTETVDFTQLTRMD